MWVVCSGRSLWIYTLIFTSIQRGGGLFASTSSPTLPQPTLDIYSRSKDSVVLICEIPEGHYGVLFMLYRFREKLASQEQQSGAKEVQFTVMVKEGDSGELFCCLYRDRAGHYSAFSPYLRLEPQKEAAPTRSTPSFPSPVLSVEPSGGVVKLGDMLTFSCSVPAPPPQSQSQSGYTKNLATFLLLRTSERTGVTSLILQLPAAQVSSPETQPGVFTLGPVKVGEEGGYTCIYQINKRRRLVNSTISNVVQVSITDLLPPPTLVLNKQTDVWHLLCTGSPAYPGAVYSLYLVNDELPVSTCHAKVIHHYVTFPLPVQETPMVSYQCKYSVLLEKKWSNSERSYPLGVTTGIQPPSSSGVDWPLVLGSASAVLLFLCSVALVAVVTHRKVKEASEKKRKSQEAQFWTQVHVKDHVVDLNLRCSSFTSQEWASEDAETASRSPILNSLSTFTTPIH